MMRETARIVMASVLAAAPTSWAAAAADVDAILDKAEQALGGHELLAGVKAIRIRSHGQWEMPARALPATPYKVEAVFRRPDQARFKWEFPEEFGGSFAFGYDGKDAWALWGGPPARTKGWLREVVLHATAELQLFLMTPARTAHGDAFAFEDAAATDDPSLVRVTYRPFASGEPWSVWFDKDAGYLVKLEHESYGMDGRPIHVRITRIAPIKAKNFDGLAFSPQSKFESTRDGQVIDGGEETVDAIEINPKLAADFFACPKWEVDAATIDVKDIAEETIVKFEHRGPYSEMSKSLAPGMDAILAAGLVPIGAASGTYLADPHAVAPQDLRTEIAVRVAKVKEGEPALPARYVLTTQPAMRVAYAYHRGDYSREAETHERLRTWMAEQGQQAAGPPRAIWFHDPNVTVTEDLITEVQIPISTSP
jgi:effector-binding domain-containing protein